MIRSLINGGITDWLYQTICMLPGIIIGLSFHEFAHAWVADRSGDGTPKAMGRLTLDPRAHIDLFGLASLILIHFGWGRPVQVNPYNFRHRRADGIRVAIAGVTMNCIIATVLGLLLNLALHTDFIAQFLVTSSAGNVIWDIWLNIVVINYGLMLFNLLPVPPLDGFNIITDIFDIRGGKLWSFVYSNSMWILLAFIILDLPSLLISRPLSFLVNIVCFGVL